jgi:hypothetical protein
MNVPQGQPRIACRFNGGCASPTRFKSRRDGRKHFLNDPLFGRPSGTFSIIAQNPRLKPWAIIVRLSEA